VSQVLAAPVVSREAKEDSGFIGFVKQGYDLAAKTMAQIADALAVPGEVAGKLGEDYDRQKSAAAVGAAGIEAALQRLENRSARFVFSVLQILRSTGSAESPNRAPYQWLIAGQASASPRLALIFRAISAPKGIADADYEGLPPEQAREIKSFIGLRSWDDPIAGLPRLGKSGAALTDEQKAQQQEQIGYIRTRRESASAAGNRLKDHKISSGPNKDKAGLEYGGSGKAEPNPTKTVEGSLKAAIWKELAAEGSSAAINTYDNQRFTWGRGWSALSTLPKLVQGYFKADPQLRQELMEAGFTNDGAAKAPGDSWLFVDVERGVVLEGKAALEALQTNRKFANVLIEIAEDDEHLQKMVDTQFEQIKYPKAFEEQWNAQKWTEETARFAFHCAHWGSKLDEAVAVGPDLLKLAKWIAAQRIDQRESKGNLQVVGAGASATIRVMADHAVEKLLSGQSAEPLSEHSEPGIYVQFGERKSKGGAAVKVYKVLKAP